MPTKSIIYYTDSRLENGIGPLIRSYIEKAGLPIVSSSLKPLDFGDNYHIDLERGYLTMFRQILTALQHSTAEIVFFCEHDVLYPESHFEFIPPEKDIFYYNHNWWKIGKGNLAVHWDADQVSGLACYRDLAIDFYKNRINKFDPDNFNRKFEPMSGKKSESWWSPDPYIDIRGNWNLTYNKWSIDNFRDKTTAKNFQSKTIDEIPGWDNAILKGLIGN